MVPRYASLLATAEIGLGSLIHAAQIPLGGHWLSLNQGLILALATRASKGRADAVRNTSLIATIAALFKALSPAGKRLTPMLAISVQGLGFAVGVGVGGANVVGAAMGMSLLALWGFAQPLIVAYLLFGKSWFAGLQKIWLEVAALFQLPPQLQWWLFGGVVLLKLTLGLLIVIVAWNRAGFEEQYQQRVTQWQQKLLVSSKLSQGAGKFRLILRDLLHWPFVLALGFSVFFFAYSGEKNAQGIWTWLLRPLVLGILFFWATRSVPKTFWQKLLNRFPLLQSTYRDTFRSRT